MKVKNTAEEFDDCIGKVDESQVNTLADLMGIDNKFSPEDEDEAWKHVTEKNWKKNWKGMPSYQSDDQTAHHRIIVNFTSDEDFEDFCQKLGIEDKISTKTKSTFYPIVEKTPISLLRWVDETDVDTMGDTSMEEPD